jgi:hypothetical protein
MKKILLALAGGAMIALSAMSHAQTAKPAAAAPQGPTADEKAQERAVANYRKNKGMDAKPAAAMGAKAPAKKKM